MTQEHDIKTTDYRRTGLIMTDIDIAHNYTNAMRQG